MSTTFSGTNSELYEISNFDQLVGLRSGKDRNFRIAVIHENINSAIYTSVTIYNEAVNVAVLSMLVSCENDILGVDDAIIGRDKFISVLSAFGFNVRFKEQMSLTPDTISFLQSLYDVGYRFFNFTADGMYVYMVDSDTKAKANVFTNFDKCDFSKLILSDEPQSFYNIGDYI